LDRKGLTGESKNKTVHRLHPYLGKFIPQIVEIFPRKFRPQLVYDPFCGSGTTLVEARALGICSIGVDISVFNVLLSRVKTGKYNLNLLSQEVHNILFSMDFQPTDANKTDNQYLNEWFS